MKLRVLDAIGTLVAEIDNVTHRMIGHHGALVVTADAHAGLPDIEVFNSSIWARVQEFHDSPIRVPVAIEPDQIIRRALTDYGPGFVPAPFNPDVHEAMQTICACDSLRCPVILNPPTEEGKRRGRLLSGATRRPVTGAELAPLMRCCWEAGHDQDTNPCDWREGGWPYGPADHHPRCPRHPDTYNRPVEGQPHPAGITTDGEQHISTPVARAVAILERDHPEVAAGLSTLADDLAMLTDIREQAWGPSGRVDGGGWGVGPVEWPQDPSQGVGGEGQPL